VHQDELLVRCDPDIHLDAVHAHDDSGSERGEAVLGCDHAAVSARAPVGHHHGLMAFGIDYTTEGHGRYPTG